MSSAERKRRFRSMGSHGGNSRKAKETRRYPLRKVVNEFASKEVTVGDSTYRVEAVELECGHKVRPPTDIVGRRYPARMRCRKCWEAEQGSSE